MKTLDAVLGQIALAFSACDLNDSGAPFRRTAADIADFVSRTRILFQDK